MSAPTITAYIAIGANLGDRRSTIEAALKRLAATPGVSSLRVSTLLENPAVGGPADSPPFLNGAAAIETTLTPIELLDRLLEIESSLGRIRRERWAARTIDLDLLLHGDTVMNSDRLTLPHPRLHDRRFVLQPLNEIAPNLCLPSGESVAALLSGCLQR